MSKQLKIDFHLKTGFSLKEKTGFIGLSAPTSIKKFEEKNDEGIIEAGLIFIAHWIPVEVHWKNKDGKLIKPSQTEINEDEVFFWFEKLNIEEAKRLISPSAPKLEIDSKSLSFELKVEHFEIDLEFRMKLKNSSKETIDNIVNVISEFVGTWNKKRENQSRHQGLIHNFDFSTPKGSELYFRFDWGSASLQTMAELLKILSETGGIKSIHIGSIFSEVPEDIRFLKGKILSKNEPLIGAKVYVVNKPENWIKTNLKGEFILEVPKGEKFKLQVIDSSFTKQPKPIKVKKTENEILLRAKGNNFKKDR